MTEPEDMIVPMLKEMRAETGDLRTEMKEEFAAVRKRLDTIDGRQKSFNNALTADTMMSRFVTGDFEERIGTLEKKVEQLIKGN
jgi:tetrahydromethanopterin S-methyltransferase subunit G